MKLNLKDRIVLPGIFPKEGKFETLILIEDIKNKIQITQKELKEFEIRTEENSIKWNEEGAKKEFDIDFTESEKNTIGDIFKKLSDEGKLSVDFITLYKLFVK